MRLATNPYTNIPKNGNPDLYRLGMFKTDPIDQRINTTKIIFNDDGIGFQPFSSCITVFLRQYQLWAKSVNQIIRVLKLLQPE